jgi:hypothetical protein
MARRLPKRRSKVYGRVMGSSRLGRSSMISLGIFCTRTLPDIRGWSKAGADEGVKPYIVAGSTTILADEHSIEVMLSQVLFGYNKPEQHALWVRRQWMSLLIYHTPYWLKSLDLRTAKSPDGPHHGCTKSWNLHSSAYLGGEWGGDED